MNNCKSKIKINIIIHKFEFLFLMNCPISFNLSGNPFKNSFIKIYSYFN